MTPENLLRAAGYWPAVERASRLHGVAPREIVGKVRDASIVAARRELWWILRDTFGLSFRRIAHLCGVTHRAVMALVEQREAALQAAYRAEAAE